MVSSIFTQKNPVNFAYIFKFNLEKNVAFFGTNGFLCHHSLWKEQDLFIYNDGKARDENK